MKEGFVRKIVALVLATGFVAVLAGCSPVSQLAGCVPAAPSGDASNSVTAEGSFLVKPTVGFPAPVVVPGEQSTSVSTGDGEVLQKGMIADVQASLYLGANASFIASTGYDETKPYRVVVGGKNDAVGIGIQCAAVGSRVATVLTAEEFYAADPTTLPASLKPTDTLVLITDVQRAFLGRANGVQTLPQSGMPSVVTAPDGTPGVTLPHSDPPTDLQYGASLQGSGATVKKGQSIVIQLMGIDWQTAKTFADTWSTHTAQTVVVTPATDTSAGGIPSGVVTALVGQKVGSQVVVIVPPKEGFAAGKNPSGVTDGDTLVFVIDILGIQ